MLCLISAAYTISSGATEKLDTTQILWASRRARPQKPRDRRASLAEPLSLSGPDFDWESFIHPAHYMGYSSEQVKDLSEERMAHKDPVTPELRELVMQRDLRQWYLLRGHILELRPDITTRPGCVATIVDPAGSGGCSGQLTLDHVKDYLMMGKRAPSDELHLATICLGHHIESSWATSNRPKLRWYLKKLYATDT